MQKLSLNKMFAKVFWGLLLLVANSAFAGVAIVTHPASEVTALSVKKVSRFYFAKDLTFDNGKSVVLVEQSPDQAIRKIFYAKVLRKTESSVKRRWSKMLFTGKASPPKVLKNDAEIKAYIADNPGSIGYISSDAVDDSVKVLLQVD